MSTNPPDLNVLVDKLQGPESPRWHEDRLWFSDIMGQKVATLTIDGVFDVVHQLPADRPSGLGWDVDGRLLVVGQVSGKLMREADGELVEFCDLTPLVRPNGEGDYLRPNDMVVDNRGRAYIGSLSMTGAGVTPLILVEPDGTAEILADDLLAPNGLVITPDGSTLIAADAGASRLVAFTIDESGRFSDRHVYAHLEGSPDGICIDAQGLVWAALPSRNRVVRVADGGRIEATIELGDRSPLAPMLGGPDGRTLFLAIVGGAWTPERDNFVDSSGSIFTGSYECVRVDVPHGGLP